MLKNEVIDLDDAIAVIEKLLNVSGEKVALDCVQIVIEDAKAEEVPQESFDLPEEIIRIMESRSMESGDIPKQESEDSGGAPHGG